MSPLSRKAPGIELALLGFLRQGPLHGYQLHQMVKDPAGLGKIWFIKQSHLYALLTRLEEDGFVSAEIVFADDARPPRRMVKLTEKGEAVYREWITTPVNALRMMRQEFMAKYYFAEQEGPNTVKSLIDAQIRTCREWLDAIHRETIDEQSFQCQVLQYRLGQIQAALDWLDPLQ